MDDKYITPIFRGILRGVKILLRGGLSKNMARFFYDAYIPQSYAAIFLLNQLATVTRIRTSWCQIFRTFGTFKTLASQKLQQLQGSGHRQLRRCISAYAVITRILRGGLQDQPRLGELVLPTVATVTDIWTLTIRILETFVTYSKSSFQKLQQSHRSGL